MTTSLHHSKLTLFQYTILLHFSRTIEKCSLWCVWWNGIWGSPYTIQGEVDWSHSWVNRSKIREIHSAYTGWRNRKGSIPSMHLFGHWWQHDHFRSSKKNKVNQNLCEWSSSTLFSTECFEKLFSIFAFFIQRLYILKIILLNQHLVISSLHIIILGDSHLEIWWLVLNWQKSLLLDEKHLPILPLSNPLIIYPKTVYLSVCLSVYRSVCFSDICLSV